MITVKDLPERPTPGVYLYCAHCGEQSSAWRGDYFWMPPDRPFRCNCSPGRPALELVHETIVRTRIPYAPRT